MLACLRRTVTWSQQHWRYSGGIDVHSLFRIQVSLDRPGTIGGTQGGFVLSGAWRALSTERESSSKETKQRYSGQRRPPPSGFAVVKDVVSLLAVYRRLRGHCKVPADFVVPSSALWPKQFHGCQLGEQIYKVRRMKNLLSSNDMERLEKVGMVWSTKRYGSDEIVRALLTYKAQHGNVEVPADFEVSPGDIRWDRFLWGMPLGQLVQDIRSCRLYWNFRSQFEALGLAIKQKQPPPAFEDFRRALSKYFELHGHYHVPFEYAIALNDEKYEQSARGMPLGPLVDRIIRHSLYSEHEKEFEEMGISIDELRRTQVDKVCAAIPYYQKRFGETASVPVEYVVPKGSKAYPQSLWGLRLGRYILNISRGEIFREYHDALHAAGVPMTRPASTGDFAQEIRTVESLFPLHRSVFRHSCVLPSFTVPPVAPWPLKWHHHPLGKDVELLRQNKDKLSAEAVQRLSEVGMVWSMEEFTVDQILRALKTYKTVKGPLEIMHPQYTVPYGSKTWDRDLWGMRLGSALRDILFYDRFRAYRSRFESLGMRFDHCDVSQYTFDMVKQALETYQAINDTLDVAASYVIDRGDAAYAENLRGMNLGHIVARIREQAVFVEHVKELEAMGFPFKSKYQLEAEQICEGVRCYRRFFGDRVSIPYPYVIPKNTEAFPRDLWGFALGQKVNHVRKRGVLRQYLPLLKEAGLESSLLPYEGPFAYEMTVVLTLLPVFQQLHGHGCVPKDFSVPATEDWPKEWHRYRLGQDITVLRKYRAMMPVVDRLRLENEGMVWSLENFEADQVRRGLTTFKSIHNNVVIAKSFVIPHGDTQWGRDLWGLRLGSAVYDICHNGHMRSHRTEFMALGLDIKDAAVKPSHPFELVCEALKAHKAQFGSFKVHRRFVIDAEDTAYPKAVRGMKLGEIVRSMRFEALYADRRDELKAMGISFTEDDEPSAERICDALRCFYQINPPNKTIGPNFFVPKQAPYPKDLWGLALGQRVFKIRNSTYLADYRDRFEAAGLRLDAKAPPPDDEVVVVRYPRR